MAIFKPDSPPPWSAAAFSFPRLWSVIKEKFNMLLKMFHQHSMLSHCTNDILLRAAISSVFVIRSTKILQDIREVLFKMPQNLSTSFSLFYRLDKWSLRVQPCNSLFSYQSSALSLPKVSLHFLPRISRELWLLSCINSFQIANQSYSAARRRNMMMERRKKRSTRDFLCQIDGSGSFIFLKTRQYHENSCFTCNSRFVTWY